MATFQLTDGFGLNVTITPAKGALSKYFRNFPSFSVLKTDLSQIANEDLTNPTITKVQSGVSFSDPIDMGQPSVELKVGTTGSGNLSIFVPSKDGAPLFDPDVFGDNIKVGANQRYVSFALSAGLTGSASDTKGDLKFGFDGKSNVTLSYYERFTAGTTVVAAVTGTISRFTIPGDLDDIKGMPEGSIATVESSGDLKFSGSVNLLALTNPLATVSVPVAGAVKIAGGLTIAVGADYEFSGDYQVRVQRLAENVFHLGYYRKRDSEFDFTVSANASITAKLGDNDLIASLMKAISSDPAADLKQLEASGMSADQAKAIQTAVKSAINRTLEIGASVELSVTEESDAMFLYEVDLDAVQQGDLPILHSALEGDLTGLVDSDPTPPAGIKVLKTLISRSTTFQHSLKVNLLGIYNVLEVSKLVTQGSTAWDATTGELVLTDNISEDRIEVIASNLQAKNSDKFQQLLAEHFLITASYRAVANIVSGPDVSGLQSYFHLEQNPSKTRMRDYLSLSVGLALQTNPVAMAELGAIDDYGATTVYAEAAYTNAAFRSLFFSDNALLDPALYASAGREAIKSLVAVGDSDDFRLKLASNDALFLQLQGIGNVQSTDFANACVSAGVPQSMVPVVGTDYLNIVWFQSAMQQAGKQLLVIDQYVQSNPSVDPNNHDFVALKHKLTESLKTVVQQATADFGGPWGFATMALLGKYSSRKWLIVNSYITKELS
jgi:hypothetical protein